MCMWHTCNFKPRNLGYWFKKISGPKHKYCSNIGNFVQHMLTILFIFGQKNNNRYISLIAKWWRAKEIQLKENRLSRFQNMCLQRKSRKLRDFQLCYIDCGIYCWLSFVIDAFLELVQFYLPVSFISITNIIEIYIFFI